MINFSDDLRLNIGRGKASSGEYEDALELISDVHTPEARKLRADWSYRYGKQLVSAGKYDAAKVSFAAANQHHEHPFVRTLAQKRNELLNKILNGEIQPVNEMADQFEDINISEATRLPPETYAPLISFVGCPAAYRSWRDPKRSDPLSTFIRLVKRKSISPAESARLVKAIDRLGEFLAWYAHSKTPLLRDADLLAPVPADPERSADRGYSVPLILAAKVAARCAIPLCTNLIEPTGPLPELRSLPKSARAGAIQDAYTGTQKAAMLANRDVVVVDDVLTTGVTLKEVALVLRDCGCRSVSALVLAHTEWSG